MTSFSLFIVDELLEAHTDYRDNQLNLYKIDRAKEISEAFQAALLAHRLKRLSLIDPQITRAQCLAADRVAREESPGSANIWMMRSPDSSGLDKNRRAVDDRVDGAAAG